MVVRDCMGFVGLCGLKGVYAAVWVVGDCMGFYGAV